MTAKERIQEEIDRIRSGIGPPSTYEDDRDDIEFVNGLQWALKTIEEHKNNDTA